MRPPSATCSGLMTRRRRSSRLKLEPRTCNPAGCAATRSDAWVRGRCRRQGISLASPPWMVSCAWAHSVSGRFNRYAKSTLTCRQAAAAIPFFPPTDAVPTMSTIELVDPELRDALALWPQVSLTAETLTRRRADALALLSFVPKPDLPDIATGEIHVESAFGAQPIRVLTYRPIRSDAPLPVIVHIHGGGFVMGAPAMKEVENRLFASELRFAIYSVHHRLAPEAPPPARVVDMSLGFVWLPANARQPDLDPGRIRIK